MIKTVEAARASEKCYMRLCYAFRNAPWNNGQEASRMFREVDELWDRMNAARARQGLGPVEQPTLLDSAELIR